MADEAAYDLSTLTADIVSAYVSYNMVAAGDLATLIQSVHTALGAAGEPATPSVEDHTQDKAAIKRSMTPGHLTSFIDGKTYKSLKRHLSTKGMTPDEYRAKFGLPMDYPMVAQAYSAHRSALAKSLGLGRKAAAVPSPEPVRDKGRRGPKPKAIKAEEETFS